VPGPAWTQRLICQYPQLDSKCAGDRPGNLVLDREDIGELTAISLRPQVETVWGTNISNAGMMSLISSTLSDNTALETSPISNFGVMSLINR